MYKSKISKKAGNIKKEEEMRKIKIVKNIGNIITWIILVSFTTTSISWAGPLSLKQNHLRPISADESAVAKELAKDIPTANLTHGEVAHQLRNTSKYRDLYDVLGLEVTTMLLESAQYHGLPIEDIVKGLFSNDELDQRNAIQSFLDHQGENARASSGGKALVLGGGTGTEPSIKALRGLGYDVTGVLAAIDDGGASFDIIYSLAHYNHTRHGDFRDSYGRIPPLGDLASSLFKGFASSDKLYKILDDQGRIILLGDLVKQLEAEGRIRTNGDNIIFYGRSKKTPTFYMKIEDFNNHKESLVIFDKNGSIINYASTFKELLIALLKETVKSISEGKGVGHTASERNTDQTLSPGFVFFASSILNLAEIIDTKYFDTYIIRKKGASIRNLLLLAALDYVGLLVPGKGESSPWESAIATDDDKQCFQLALDALAEMADIKNGRVMLSHYDPTTVCAVYDANVIIVNQGTDRAGKEHLTAFTVKVDRNTGKMSVGIDDKKQLIAEDIEPGNTISYTTTVPEGSGLSPTVIEIKNDVGSITFKVNSSDSCEITEYNGNPATTYVNYGGVKRIVAQDGTGRAKYTSDKPDYELPADLPGELTENELPYYAPLKINGVDVYVRSRFVARQTNVTKTTVFSPLSKSVKFGRTQPSLTLPFEDVLNIRRDPSKSKVQKTYYYMQDLTQRVDANNELIEQILDENTNIIVIGPGSFLTSEVAHLLTKGLIEALASRCQRGDIPIIFVTNPNLTSETVGYDLKGLIERVEAIAKQLTGEDYHFGNIFNTLVAGDLDTVKLQKHLQGDADFVADEPIEASVCIRMIQENPLLLDNLNLDYIKYLIDDFLKRAKKGQVPAMEYILGAYPVFGEIDNRRRYIWAISDPNFLEEKLSIFDEDEKPLTARDDQGRVRQLTKPMTLLEYLRIKLQQLQDTLYEPSYAEILTSSDPRLRKSKKSQGPLTYKQSDIDALKEANPNLTIDSDVSMAGTRILPTREPGASSVLRVAFIDDLYAKAMQRAASRTIDTKSNDFVSYSLQEAIKVIRSGSPELAAAAANMVEERLLVLDIPVVKKGWVFNDETRTVSSTLLSRNIIEEVPSKILAAILVGLMEGANVFEQKGRLDHAKDAENNSVQAFLVKVGEFPEVADETLDVLKSRLSVASARSITQPDLIGALRILYPEEASDISSVSEANNMLLGDFRKEIETRFLNGHDIVDTQREKVTVVAQDRARRALVAMALALSKKQKQMKDIQKEDFDQLLGLRVAAGISGLGERFSPDTLVNKYWAGTNTGETYIRLAFTEAFDIWGVTPIACADRMAMNELLKPGITRADVEAAASAQEGDSTSIVLSHDFLDERKIAELVGPEDTIIAYPHNIKGWEPHDPIFKAGGGSGLDTYKVFSLLEETGSLDRVRYVCYIFAENAQQVLNNKVNSIFINWLEAISGGYQITAASKIAAETIQAKGNFFFDSMGRLTSLRDWDTFRVMDNTDLVKELAALAGSGVDSAKGFSEVTDLPQDLQGLQELRDKIMAEAIAKGIYPEGFVSDDVLSDNRKLFDVIRSLAQNGVEKAAAISSITDLPQTADGLKALRASIAEEAVESGIYPKLKTTDVLSFEQRRLLESGAETTMPINAGMLIISTDIYEPGGHGILRKAFTLGTIDPKTREKKVLVQDLAYATRKLWKEKPLKERPAGAYPIGYVDLGYERVVPTNIKDAGRGNRFLVAYRQQLEDRFRQAGVNFTSRSSSSGQTDIKPLELSVFTSNAMAATPEMLAEIFGKNVTLSGRVHIDCSGKFVDGKFIPDLKVGDGVLIEDTALIGKNTVKEGVRLKGCIFEDAGSISGNSVDEYVSTRTEPAVADTVPDVTLTKEKDIVLSQLAKRGPKPLEPDEREAVHVTSHVGQLAKTPALDENKKEIVHRGGVNYDERHVRLKLLGDFNKLGNLIKLFGTTTRKGYVGIDQVYIVGDITLSDAVKICNGTYLEDSDVRGASFVGAGTGLRRTTVSNSILDNNLLTTRDDRGKLKDRYYLPPRAGRMNSLSIYVDSVVENSYIGAGSGVPYAREHGRNAIIGLTIKNSVIPEGWVVDKDIEGRLPELGTLIRDGDLEDSDRLFERMHNILNDGEGLPANVLQTGRTTAVAAALIYKLLDDTERPDGGINLTIAQAIFKLGLEDLKAADMLIDKMNIVFTLSNVTDKRLYIRTKNVIDAVDTKKPVVQPTEKDMRGNILTNMDIRGRALTQLNETTVKRVASAFADEIGSIKAETLRQKLVGGEQITDDDRIVKIVIGSDIRISSPFIMEWLRDALSRLKLEYEDIGTLHVQVLDISGKPVTTPLLYYSTAMLEADGGIMVTASHLESDWGGLKFTRRMDDISDSIELEKLDIILSNAASKEYGYVDERNIVIVDCFQDYIDQLGAAIGNLTGKKIVVDVGNGAATFYPDILRQKGAKVVELYTTPDGTFPNHRPDPERAANVEDLIAAVKAEEADLGVAFDTDGDRVGLIDNEGNRIGGNFLLALLTDKLVDEGDTVVYSNRVSKMVLDKAHAKGAKPIIHSTGNMFIKAKMRKLLEEGESVPFGAETTGHVMVRESGYLDDGMYAATILIAAYLTAETPLSKVCDGFEKFVNPATQKLSLLPLLKAGEKDGERIKALKRKIEREIAAHFRKDNTCVVDTINGTDGPRITFYDQPLPEDPTEEWTEEHYIGWILIRGSLTAEVVGFDAEAKTRDDVYKLSRKIYEVLKQYGDDIKHIRLKQYGDFLHAEDLAAKSHTELAAGNTDLAVNLHEQALKIAKDLPEDRGGLFSKRKNAILKSLVGIKAGDEASSEGRASSAGIQPELKGLSDKLEISEEVLVASILGSINPLQFVTDVAEAGGRETDKVLAELRTLPMLRAIMTRYFSASDRSQPIDAIGSYSIAEFTGLIADVAQNQNATPERMADIFFNCIEPDTFIGSLAGQAKDFVTVANILKTCPPLALIATRYRVMHLEDAATGNMVTLNAEDIVSPDIASEYAPGVLDITVTLPEDFQVDEGQYGVVMDHLEEVAKATAQREYNYRGDITGYYAHFFDTEARAYDDFVERHFTSNGRDIKYIVSSGQGANEMYSHHIAALHNAFGKSGIAWLVIDRPGDLKRLPQDVTAENTLFFEVSRSGDTQETLKLLQLTHQRFPVRIVYANKGPLRKAAEAFNAQTDSILIRNLPQDIGGRLMRRRSPILLGLMHLAGMDTDAYIRATDQFDQRLDFARGENSLAVRLARFIYISMVLGGKDDLALMYNNPEFFEPSAKEFRQLLLEGANEKPELKLFVSRHELPKDAHASMQGVFDQANTLIAYAMVSKKSGFAADDETILRPEDLAGVEGDAEQQHAGLSVNDMEEAFVFPNLAKTQSYMPAILAVAESPTPEVASALSSLSEDVTVHLCAIEGIDPNSNLQVKSVREGTKASLLQKTEGRASSAGLDADNIPSLTKQALIDAEAQAIGDFINVYAHARLGAEAAASVKGGAVMINDTDMVQGSEQTIAIKKLYRQDNPLLQALRQDLSCLIFLRSEKGSLSAEDRALLDQSRAEGKLIYISEDTTDGYEDAKHLKIPNMSEANFPILPSICAGKIFVSYKNAQDITNALNKNDFFAKAFGREATQGDVEQFLLEGVYILPLPTFDYEKVEYMQRQSLAAAIAA